MVKLLIQSYLIILAIPFITFAIDPKDPKTICDRLVVEKKKNSCREIAEHNALDWYAAAACNSLDDDDTFMKCWKQIIDAKFNPETLDFCTSHLDDSDSDKFNCILSVKNKSVSKDQIDSCTKETKATDYQKCIEKNSRRNPASSNESEFQSFK